ncbi:trimethylamine methyltransferase family protein [Natranaerofaba carboxydovora]|uniref:trimethylamine methyltransferase family protein n=1 Tax=Natranaerofaba carboxydovora TaxID=2742683 RepID=UPI001F12ED2E|nr:trimethylamine methyltransferase family protein [Natranaerofaba carboxydovora]UMZ73830.1 Trimethylamine methyltransferase (MTTB) [Natranaerofaba carboxydovora]
MKKSNYVRSNYTTNDTPQAKVLTKDQCRRIVSTAVEMLERTGVDVYYDKAREILADHGCHVDGKRVKIPSGLMEWAIRTAPSRVTMTDMKGERKLYLEGSNSYYGPGPTNTFWIDPYTEERRKPNKDDKRNVGKVCDQLDNIDYVMDLGTPTGVTYNLADVHAFEAMIQNTTKPICHWGFGVEQYEVMTDMAIAIKGSLEELRHEPFVAFYSEPSPPSIQDYDAISKAMWAAEKGLPKVYTPCIMGGATAPASIAGVLAQSLVTSFPGLLAGQLVNPGAPFIIGGLIAIMDMQSTILSYGSAEFMLMQGAMADLGHYMEIPIFGTAGCTDSKLLDEQAAIESALSIGMAATMGANLVHDVGYSEYGNTGSLYQCVLGDEVVGMVGRIMEGIEVSDETLALDVIDKVGPGGHFLGESHTMKNFKNEFWFPDLIDRQRYEAWQKSGSKSMRDRVKEKTVRLIENDRPEVLSEDVQKDIADILEEAEKKFAEKNK